MSSVGIICNKYIKQSVMVALWVNSTTNCQHFQQDTRSHSSCAKSFQWIVAAIGADNDRLLDFPFDILSEWHTVRQSAAVIPPAGHLMDTTESNQRMFSNQKWTLFFFFTFYFIFFFVKYRDVCRLRNKKCILFLIRFMWLLILRSNSLIFPPQIHASDRPGQGRRTQDAGRRAFI